MVIGQHLHSLIIDGTLLGRLTLDYLLAEHLLKIMRSSHWLLVSSFNSLQVKLLHVMLTIGCILFLMIQDNNINVETELDFDAVQREVSRITETDFQFYS